MKPAAFIVLALSLSDCQQDRQARKLLDQATSLAEKYSPDAEQKILVEIITRHGNTTEATEARQMLAALNATVSNWFKTGISGFRSDCGRPPTHEEGLKALFDNPGIKCWGGPYLPDIFAPMKPEYNSETGEITELK
jgi:hypothetical protein